MALLINSKLTKKWVSPSSLELEALLVSDVVAMPLFLVAPSLCYRSVCLKTKDTALVI